MDVRKIQPPMGDDYFEATSADGFAFMGMAYHNTGLDSAEYDNEITERRYTLGAKNKCRNIKVSSRATYTYTHWVCYEFLRLTGRQTAHIVENIKDIGRYPSGWHRYCDEEINYVVPNITAMAALVYIENNIPGGEEMIDLLRRSQVKGNWYYLKDGVRHTKEDNYHLGLMLYCFYRLGLKEDMVLNSLSAYVKTKALLNPGSAGWGIPLAYLIHSLYKHDVLNVIEEEEYDYRIKTYKENAIRFTKEHINYRVRAISAWALTHK